MELDEKKIIGILPLDEAFKKDLLEKYDTLDQGKKMELGALLWDTYDALYGLKLQENVQLGMEKAREGGEKLDPEFYARMHKKTDEDMAKITFAGAEQVDLEGVRAKLQSFLQH